jgi:hypothetical protein
LDGLSPPKRGPKPDPQALALARLRREHERLQERLRQAEIIIAVHTCPGGECQGKKVAQLFGETLETPDLDDPS